MHEHNLSSLEEQAEYNTGILRQLVGRRVATFHIYSDSDGKISSNEPSPLQIQEVSTNGTTTEVSGISFDQFVKHTFSAGGHKVTEEQATSQIHLKKIVVESDVISSETLALPPEERTKPLEKHLRVYLILD